MASHAPTISSASVLRLAVGGAIGGLIAFYLLDPQMRELDGSATPNEGAALYLGAIIGAAIGMMLILADEIQAPKPLRLTRNLLLGAMVGALIGTIGVFCADAVFDPLAATHVLPLVIIGRVAGWAIVGAAAGLCPGVVAGSVVRIRQGAVGGIVGGAVGGILFDVIGMATGTGSVSRFVGFTITGLAIGVAVGLIAEYRKLYWLTVLTGGREGRNYILSKPTNLVGRDELVDVPLFGDVTVLKQHASIVLSPTGAALIARPGAPMIVNGASTPQIILQDGDVMEFGRHRLRFHQRSNSGSSVHAMPPSIGSQLPRDVGYHLAPAALPIGAASGVSRVTVIQGPHSGNVCLLTNGAIMGRDIRCDIALVGDTHLSRQHARFLLEGSNWVVEDGNSMNGVYVNGVRVARHVLQPGDQISVGETVLQAT